MNSIFTGNIQNVRTYFTGSPALTGGAHAVSKTAGDVLVNVIKQYGELGLTEAAQIAIADAFWNAKMLADTLTIQNGKGVVGHA